MGWTETLINWWNGPSGDGEVRETADAFFDRVAGASAEISQATATRLTTVLACERIIADAIAGLPAQPFIRRNGSREPYWSGVGPWLDFPHGQTRDPNYAWPTYIAELVTSVLSDGNGFVFVLPDTAAATELHVLDPKRVTVRIAPDGSKAYDVFMPDGSMEVLTGERILHIARPPIMPGTLRGVSPIDEARQALTAAYDAETYAAAYYRGGGVPSGVIEYPGEMTQERADDFKSRWNARHAGADKVSVAVLSGGMSFKAIPITFEQAQWIESRQFSVEDTARLFGVPLHMLQVSTPGAMSYASVEQNAIGFVTNTLLPIVRLIETAHDRLLPGDATFLRLNLSGLLRGDAASRAAYYQALFAAGALSPNDIRRLEDQPPIAGGDTYYVPLNLTASTVAESNAKAAAAKALGDAGWSPEEAASIVGLPAPTPRPAPVVVIPPVAPAARSEPVVVNLNVDGAEFQLPQAPAPDVRVEIADEAFAPVLASITDMLAAQRTQAADLAQGLASLRKPRRIMRTVDRDAGGNIIAIREVEA